MGDLSTVQFWTHAAFSSFVLLAAAGLTVWHVRAWREVRSLELPPEARNYHWRQFRRRIQCSAMLAVLAVLLFVGQWVESPPLHSFSFICYWGATLLLVVWLALLAVADIVATKYYFGRLRSDVIVEQAKLEAEAQRLRSLHGNGQSRDRRQITGRKRKGPDAD